MRSERVHATSRGRECLIPQVPRTFHHGAKGTFMTKVLHSQFFASVAISTDATVRWPTDEWRRLRTLLRAREYDERLRQRLRGHAGQESS